MLGMDPVISISHTYIIAICCHLTWLPLDTNNKSCSFIYPIVYIDDAGVKRIVQSITGSARGLFIVPVDWNFHPISKAYWHFITMF